MKNYIVVLFGSLLLSFSSAFAQVSIKINEESLPMSKGNNNAFVVDIPQTKAADLRKEWDSYIKRSGRRIKTGDLKGEHYALEVQATKISNDYFNIYTNFIQTITGTKVATHFQLQDTFVSSANNEFTAKSIKAYLHEFAKEQYIKAVEAEVAIEQRELKKLDDELNKLYTAKDKLTNQINDNNNSISKAESEIKIKKNEQQLKDKEILMQREKMIGVSLNPAERKLQDKIVSDLNKDKQRLVKDEQKLRKDIQKFEATIKKIERDVTKVEGDITRKLSEIKTHQTLLQNIENKLNEVRRL